MTGVFVSIVPFGLYLATEFVERCLEMGTLDQWLLRSLHPLGVSGIALSSQDEYIGHLVRKSKG